MEFLSSTGAQLFYAEQNFEYPVNPVAEPHPLVASWGNFKADIVHLSRIAAYRTEAAKIMDRVGFDH